MALITRGLAGLAGCTSSGEPAESSAVIETRTFLDLEKLSTANGGAAVTRSRLNVGPSRPEPWSAEAFTVADDAAGSFNVVVRLHKTSDRAFWEEHSIPTAFDETAPNF